ncbi:PAS domain S-box-containing protein [Pseudomonas cuatrocienegasensis]|uniref:histidine kinase n=1 Tax=Pseudomonas cuatrocienegasensis TaxID=543360 RepID=A0ABY1B7D3_9PSED|nr:MULTISPECIES: ATP-binding protein [Pseudomonas]OEC36996.1 histidine kinase [Pseudomonas sp. 21C1]SEQ13571.1 PAS domain S-box-containing protein [Pseudomonas cuatrocienegasensis]
MPPTPAHGLRQWIWRAFVRSALIPLVLVEAGLVAIYLLSNSAIRDAQIDYLRQTALADLKAAAALETRVVDEQLLGVSRLADAYRNLTTGALLGAQPEQSVELALTDSGVRHSPRDNGGAASFYSNTTPAARQDLRKVARLARLDPLMKELKGSNPLIASLYFNSWDSYNHIYPWFLTPDQYPHDMVIPDYNFYYLADATHNPERKVVWTDVYLDPAGQGWMMSAIAPVYREQFLEGVIGVDITVGGILAQIGQLEVPWNGYAMLVSSTLDIMALPEPGEDDFGLDELTSHSYEEAIRQETFKPADFNLAKRSETQSLASAIAAAPQGVHALMLGDRPHLVAWTTIAQTGWHLLTVVDEAAVFSQTEALASRYQQIGYLLIAGLFGFYLLFFAFMWARARQLSQHLLGPIDGISAMMREIGNGRWRPAAVHSDIHELDVMADKTADMGVQLETSEVQRSASQQRLELVLESATESLWEHRLDTAQIHLRGRLSSRFGLASETLDEKTFLAHVHPDDVPALRTAVQRVRDGLSARYEVEFRMRDAAGVYHWLLGRGRVLEHDPHSGQSALLAGTLVDINALKCSEAALRDASEQAQAADKAKARFISSMSHELRTPLNAIQGFAQLMRMEHQGEGRDGAPEYVEEILSASRHLNHLVSDILDWSSIQADSARLELQWVDVGDILTECAELVRVEVAERGLNLVLHTPEHPLQVQADPRRLRQVLLNLLSNATKYNSPAGRISLGYQRVAGQVRLLVEDTGLGLSDAQQEKLFEPFQRLGRENTTIQGTGIGLALCREFATQMRGRMGLRSEPGVGSCFWIELPLVGNDSVVTQGAHTQPHVFYVEDNPASQFLVRQALEDIARVSLASNGSTALERLLAEPPDLLLLDLNLPGLSGGELLARLRQNPATQHLPVVVLSAAAADDIARAMALNCQGLLGKPIDIDELRRLVSALLQEVTGHAV